MFPPNYASRSPGLTQDHISRQQTIPHAAIAHAASPFGGAMPHMPQPATEPDTPTPAVKKSIIPRILAILLLAILTIACYFIWNPSSLAASPSSATVQNSGNSFTKQPAQNSSSSNTGSMQVYIVGAVKHPGVYMLPVGARLYQLVEAAGGPLPKANLVAANLAAKLTDGEEVYITVIGEMPPTYSGGVPGVAGTGTNTGNTGNTGPLININTATVDELRLGLHVSSTTAQNIVNYRTQNGPYTSVDQLLQVVSKAIYDRIKGMVTI